MDFLVGLVSAIAEAGAGVANEMVNGFTEQVTYGNYPPVKTVDLKYHTGGNPQLSTAICVNCAFYKKSNGYCRRLCKNTATDGTCAAYDLRVTPEVIRTELEKM